MVQYAIKMIKLGFGVEQAFRSDVIKNASK